MTAARGLLRRTAALGLGCCAWGCVSHLGVLRGSGGIGKVTRV